jgi:hypothetical protein
MADQTGLTEAFSDALAGLRERRGDHDPGRVLSDLAVVLADGGRSISDLACFVTSRRCFGGRVHGDGMASRGQGRPWPY